jgi:hypothetical protein
MSDSDISSGGEADVATLKDFFDTQRGAGVTWEEIACSLNLSLSTIMRTRRRIGYVDKCMFARDPSYLEDDVSFLLI